MNNCSGCKWWEQNEDDADWGWCNLTLVDEQIPDHKDSKALAHDSDGYYAILTTRHDFGCVQWEVKDER